MNTPTPDGQAPSSFVAQGLAEQGAARATQQHAPRWPQITAVVLVLLAVAAIIAHAFSVPSSKPHEASERALVHAADCNAGLVHDSACSKQKDQEARQAEVDQEAEAIREADRLKSEGR